MLTIHPITAASSNIALPLQGELTTILTGPPAFELLLSFAISNESTALTVEPRSATHLPVRLPGQLRPADAEALSQNHDAFYLLAALIYTFSNGFAYKLHGYSPRNSTQSDILDTILEKVPRRILFTLFQGRSPSIRAAWEKLLKYLHRMQRLRWQSILRSLLQVGIHNNWLSLPNYGHFYLSCACKIADLELLQRLWAYGCRAHCDWEALRPFDRTGSKPSTIAVVESLRQGSVECAQFIIEHLKESDLASNFDIFVQNIDSLNANVMAGLDIFLKKGALVDSIIPHDYFDPEVSGHHYRYQTLSRLWDLYDSVPEAYRLSILDYYFYFDREVFQKMAPHSRVPPNEVTRSGLISALDVNMDCLHDYLSNCSNAAASRDLRLLLEVIFAEQVLLWGVFGKGIEDSLYSVHEWRRIPLHILQGLLDFGVDASLPSLPNTGPQELLTTAVENDISDTIRILQLLFENGAICDADALESAVERGDIEVLRYIASRINNIRIQTRVLARAIAEDDREVVQVLLDAGVDPTADLSSLRTLRRWFRVSSAVAEAVKGGMGHGNVQLSRGMMKCLLERGIEFKVGKHDHGPFKFIRHLIINASDREVFDTVEYILTATGSLDGVRSSKVDLLGAISRSINTAGAFSRSRWTDRAEGVRLDRLRLFQYLFRRGAHVRPQIAFESPLVVLAVLNGPAELIDEVLNAGADVQSYGLGYLHSILTPLQVAATEGNKVLVESLLEKGADVNQAAYCAGSRRGRRGATALQGICGWDPATSAERVTRMEIIKHLLDLGADVNAAPAATMGHTALQIAARMGDLEVATLLVHLGADVNAPRGRWRGKTALDGATVGGHLDMVKFLLTARAISHDRGETGYDGAIRKAEKHGHFAIADMIQQHVADNARSGFNPNIELPYRDWHEYDYRKTDSESVLSDGASSEAAGTTADSDPAQPSGTDEPREEHNADAALLDGMQDTVDPTQLSENIERRDMASKSGSFNNSVGQQLARKELWTSDSTASALMKSTPCPEDSIAQHQDEQHMNTSSAMIINDSELTELPYPEGDVISQEQLEQQMDLDWSCLLDTGMCMESTGPQENAIPQAQFEEQMDWDWNYLLDASMCIESTGSQENPISQAHLEQQMDWDWSSQLEALDAEAWTWNNG